MVTEAVANKQMLVGHSSGAIVALEALLRAASGSISGAVIYEPPLVTDQRLGGKALQDARAELASGKPGMAMQIFVRDIVTASPAMAWLARWLVTLVPKYRGRVAHQLDDVQAIEDLGNRLAAYAGISIPLVVLEGERTPRAILERSQALRRVLPNARQFVLRGQGHAAHLRAPDHVAAIIAGFAGEALD